MQLNPGERAVLARFHTLDAAKAARRDLQAAGFDIIQIDRTGEDAYSPGAATERPLFGDATSQATTFLSSSTKLPGPDAGVLTAAFPEVSGMGGPVIEQPGGILLTVVVPNDGAANRAAAIITSQGGDV